MVLNDVYIQQWAEQQVKPFDPACVNPASIDLRLAADIVEITAGGIQDASNTGAAMNSLTSRRSIRLQKGQRYVLQPGVFILASSIEYVKLPAHLAGSVQLKSTTARSGVGHVYAGWIDPGFEGQITFELFSHVPVILEPGQRICQMVLHELVEPSQKVYTGRYQYQVGPTPAMPEQPDDEPDDDKLVETTYFDDRKAIVFPGLDQSITRLDPDLHDQEDIGPAQARRYLDSFDWTQDDS